VRELTLSQVGEFLLAVERRERNKKLGDAIAARMAQAEGKTWKDYVKGLRRGG
jgi:hypothetical protein